VLARLVATGCWRSWRLADGVGAGRDLRVIRSTDVDIQIKPMAIWSIVETIDYDSGRAAAPWDLSATIPHPAALRRPIDGVFPLRVDERGVRYADSRVDYTIEDAGGRHDADQDRDPDGRSPESTPIGCLHGPGRYERVRLHDEPVLERDRDECDTVTIADPSGEVRRARLTAVAWFKREPMPSRQAGTPDASRGRPARFASDQRSSLRGCPWWYPSRKEPVAVSPPIPRGARRRRRAVQVNGLHVICGRRRCCCRGCGAFGLRGVDARTRPSLPRLRSTRSWETARRHPAPYRFGDGTTRHRVELAARGNQAGAGRAPLIDEESEQVGT